ncbi:hypothetical protein LTR28_013112, partial [Elasticomyces elasticus]
MQLAARVHPAGACVFVPTLVLLASPALCYFGTLDPSRAARLIFATARHIDVQQRLTANNNDASSSPPGRILTISPSPLTEGAESIPQTMLDSRAYLTR